MKSTSGIKSAFDKYVDAFPARRAEFLKLCKEYGWDDEDLELKIGKAKRTTTVPTFEHGFDRPASPMLAEWFDVSGTVVEGNAILLGSNDIRKMSRDATVLKCIASFRRMLGADFPFALPDRDLGIFGHDTNPIDGLVLLAWMEGTDEPRIWELRGMSISEHNNILELLKART